ncbi:MAG: discoidin domain-containing protein [Planctomycetota bacterium]
MLRPRIARVSLAALALVLVTACRSAPVVAPPPVAVTGALRELARYEPGQSRQVVAAFEARARGADPAAAAVLEAEMLWVLAAEEATGAGRQAACRLLRGIGTERAVPVLAGLLADRQLAHAARLALQGMESPRVDSALRSAARELDGDLLCGVIDSLGARRDRGAVPILAARIADGDEATVRASLTALGRIGGEAAVRVVRATDVGAAMPAVKYDALLAGAESLREEGDAPQALAIYRELSGLPHPLACRVGAWRGIVRTDPGGAIDAIGTMLATPEPAVVTAGAALLADLPAGAAVEPLARRLWTLAPPARAKALDALARRGGEPAVRAAIDALADEEEGVRAAGLAALGRAGDARHVDLLLSFAARPGPEGAAAVASLSALGGEGVDGALVSALREADEDARAAAIPCLGARGSPGAVNALLGFAARGNAAVRGASLSALRELAAAEHLPRLLLLFASLAEAAEREALGDALIAAAGRGGDAAAAGDLVARALDDWPGPPRATLLRVLGARPGPAALAPLVAAARGSDPAARLVALRALGGWPDAGPAEALAAAAEAAGEESERILARQGHLRLVRLDPERAPADVTRVHAEAYAGARTPAERTAVIESAEASAAPWGVQFLAACLAVAGADTGAAEEVAALQRARTELARTLARTVPGGAAGAAVSLATVPADRYAASGPAALTDGQWGSLSYTDGRWLGFQGADLVAVVDLGRPVRVESVWVGFLDRRESWIFPPRAMRLELSADGSSWTTAAPLPLDSALSPAARSGGGAEMPPTRVDAAGFWLAAPAEARYLRVSAENVGEIPEWHPGAGQKGWLFVDEIQVNPALGPPDPAPGE